MKLTVLQNELGGGGQEDTKGVRSEKGLVIKKRRA